MRHCRGNPLFELKCQLGFGLPCWRHGSDVKETFRVAQNVGVTVEMIAGINGTKVAESASDIMILDDKFSYVKAFNDLCTITFANFSSFNWLLMSLHF